jgi:hypothetical protein
MHAHPFHTHFPAEEHARAETIPGSQGALLRFCQQCTKLEAVSCFEGTKRSCRASLEKRHKRRSRARHVSSESGDAAAAPPPSSRRQAVSSGGGGGGTGSPETAAGAVAYGEHDDVSSSPTWGHPGSAEAGAASNLNALLAAALPAQPEPLQEARSSGIFGRLAPAAVLAAHAANPGERLKQTAAQ